MKNDDDRPSQDISQFLEKWNKFTPSMCRRHTHTHTHTHIEREREKRRRRREGVMAVINTRCVKIS